MFRELAERYVGLDGDIVEVGVYEGGTAKALKSLAPGKMIFLYDTFAGIPKEKFSLNDEKSSQFADLEGVGKGIRTGVAEELSSMGFIVEKGIFPDESKRFPEKICMVHIDADLYQTTKDAINLFGEKLINGGGILIHDYHNSITPGVKDAVDEQKDRFVFKDHKEYVELVKEPI